MLRGGRVGAVGSSVSDGDPTDVAAGEVLANVLVRCALELEKCRPTCRALPASIRAPVRGFSQRTAYTSVRAANSARVERDLHLGRRVVVHACEAA